MLPASLTAPPPNASLAPGVSYTVTGYSQAGDYTLVRWQIKRAGDDVGGFGGESLYIGTPPNTRLIASSGGQLDLSPSDVAITQYSDPLLIPPPTSASLCPTAIANQLRDPLNYIAEEV